MSVAGCLHGVDFHAAETSVEKRFGAIPILANWLLFNAEGLLAAAVNQEEAKQIPAEPRRRPAQDSNLQATLDLMSLKRAMR